MKKLSLIAAFVASVALLGSCLRGEEAAPVPAGGMTFINTFIEANQVAYRLDQSYIQDQFNPLDYRSYGFGLLFARENRRLEIYSAYEQARLVDTTFTIRDSVFYSSIVYGTHDDPRHFVTIDRIPDGVDDPREVAAVRFYNLANLPHRVTLRIGDIEPVAAFRDRPLETPATGKAAEGFNLITPGTYTLTVVDEDGETITTRQGIELPKGTYTSIFLTGDEREPSTFYVGRIYQRVN